MKNQLLFFVIIFIQLNIKAQITLDHTFPSYPTIPVKTHLRTVYYFPSLATKQIHFYNEDYSFYKTTTIIPPNGYKLNEIGTNLSDQLFNSDNLLEFLCRFTDTLNNTGYLLKLYNEDGSELFNFGNALGGFIPHKTFSNEVRLNVARYLTYPNNLVTDVYSLPGSIVTGSILHPNETTEYNPYPNPTFSIINLSYKLEAAEITNMQIFNSNGQIIDTLKIGGSFEKIRLDVSSYAKGIYFYKYNNETRKFIVE